MKFLKVCKNFLSPKSRIWCLWERGNAYLIKSVCSKNCFSKSWGKVYYVFRLAVFTIYPRAKQSDFFSAGWDKATIFGPLWVKQPPIVGFALGLFQRGLWTPNLIQKCWADFSSHYKDRRDPYLLLGSATINSSQIWILQAMSILSTQSINQPFVQNAIIRHQTPPTKILSIWNDHSKF